MIDTDRLDVSQPIDLSSICNTGLYTINPQHKHFGIQLTDEVRQQVLGCHDIECLLG
jgi:large subunit ribosomal protein L15